jgi:hypothetical protein
MENLDEKIAVAKTAVPAQLRGETIAYALQSGLYNLGANFIEPYIGYQTQKQYSKYDPAHPEKFGTYTQNLAGEFAGDLIGCTTLIAAEALFPEQLHAFTRAARRVVDPLYSTVAHRVFAKEKSEPDYEKKVEAWKTFQERNLVRSLIIASAGIAGNVATQKLLLHNPSPTGIIFSGKLISSALTTGVGLCVRLAFPDKMKRVDTWIGKKVAPLLSDKNATSETAEPAHAEDLLRRKEQELNYFTRY